MSVKRREKQTKKNDRFFSQYNSLSLDFYNLPILPQKYILIVSNRTESLLTILNIT